MKPVERVLKFWFGSLEGPESWPEDKAARWWLKDDKFDAAIKEEFLPNLEAEARGELEFWTQSPHSTLALIILLDQFPRNMFRGTADAFAYDQKALQLCLHGRELGFDQRLYPVERAFFYMPLEHSEDMEMQNLSVECFQELLASGPAALKEQLTANLDYAEKHRAIIERFGRFPHRNAILGRESTLEELEFLKEPGSSF